MRLVSLLMVVLLLTFGAVYKLTDATGVNSFLPEIVLALAQLAVLGASYHLPLLRRHYGQVMKTFCYLTVGWFIALAALNGFDSNYAVGLLFIVPGLGVGYSVASRQILPLAGFFLFACVAASAACIAAAGAGAASLFFVASLLCISLVTMFVAAGWLDAQKRYLASEERYRAVVEQASDGIYMLDAETLACLDANRAFCQMAGMSLTELRNTSIRDLIDHLPNHQRESNERPDTKQSIVKERMLRCADGTKRLVELKVDRISHQDGDMLSVVVHDITSRRNYEERMRTAQANAAEIASFKSSLLTNMSHEIRTPICSILGWTAVLRDELPEHQRELVRLIEESGKRLHNTLDSVIELAHLNANARKLKPTTVDLPSLISDVAASFAAPSEGEGAEIVFEKSSRPIWAELDAVCLKRVLHHLLDNAVKFTKEGKITVSVKQMGPEIAIAVEDTGIGIGEEFLPAVFDEFRQESAGLARDHEGNGLGLAIARRLTELLEGRIEVTSERGVGSTFTVFVPGRQEKHAPALLEV